MNYRKLTRDEVLALATQFKADNTALAAYIRKIAPNVRYAVITSTSEYNDEYYEVEIMVRVFDARRTPIDAYFDDDTIKTHIGVSQRDTNYDAPEDINLLIDLDDVTATYPDLYVLE